MSTFRPLSETKFINDANLVAYWKLEDTSDSKGSFTLTNNGTTQFNAGKFGNAADFGNANVSKSLSIASNLGITGGACSISCWVNVTTAPANATFSYFVAVADGGTHTIPAIAYYNNAGTYLVTFYRKKPGVADDGPTPAYTLATGTWYHLVMTYDGSNVRGYANGALIGAPTASSGNGSLFSTETDIGKIQGATPGYTSGLVDDTAVFNRALSASEVNELYQGMTLGEYLPNSNTKLLLHLNGSSVDSSGNNNDGTDTAITYSQANGRFGMGAGFGATSKITTTISSNTINIGTGDFTMGLWFKRNSISTFQGMFTNRDGDLTGYQIFMGADNLLNGNITNGTEQAITSNSAITDTTLWHQVIFTRISGTMYLYQDGKSVATPLANTRNGNNTYAFNLGVFRQNSNDAHWLGNFDEPLLELGGWTPQQVAKYYANSRGFYACL